MQGITSPQAQLEYFIKELTIQPDIDENSHIVLLTSNELANLVLKTSSEVRDKTSISLLLENIVRVIGESGIAERVLLFQVNENKKKLYLTNYWQSSYVSNYNPIGFDIDLNDPPFKSFCLPENKTIQIEDITKHLFLPNYMFKNKYKALLLKLKSKSISVTVGSSQKIKIVLNLQFCSRNVIWSNEIEKAMQSIVNQLAVAIEKYSEEKKKKMLQKSISSLRERAVIEKENLLKRFAEDIHDLPCSVIPNLKSAIQKGDLTESQRLVDELHNTLRQLINEYVVPELNLLGFVGCVNQFVNGFKKSFKGKVTIDFTDEEIDVCEKNAIELFKIIKEWFCNIEKHSEASEITIEIKKLNDLYFTVFISDDGKGFNLERARTLGYGISNIERRLKAVNAQYAISSMKEKGAKITIQANIG